MKRSKWKAYSLDKEDSYVRSTLITPSMIGVVLSVSNGKIVKEIKLTSDHVGHRLGEFSHTKVTPRFKGGKKN